MKLFWGRSIDFHIKVWLSHKFSVSCLLPKICTFHKRQKTLLFLNRFKFQSKNLVWGKEEEACVWNVLILFHFLWIIDAFPPFISPTILFVLTICSGNLNWILYFYTYKQPIQYLLSKPFKKCETLSTFSYVHTRRKMLVGFGVAVAVMISWWLLYASLVKNEEERGVKLLNNLILVPFFCIINLSLYFSNSR